MFKAKLISNTEYYKLRSKNLLLMLLPTIPIAFLANFYLLPWLITVMILIVYFLILFLTSKNQNLMSAMIGQNIIELDNDEVRIKSHKGSPQESFKLNEIDKIVLQSEYGIAQESMKDITQEITGNPKTNFLIIHQNNKEHKFDFEVDSHYMINQLNKVIGQWSKVGLKIEKVV